MTSPQKKYHPVDYKQRHVLINRNCLALVLQEDRTKSDGQNGHDIFLDFLQQNSMCFWNSCLSRSVSSLEYKGYLVPCTLLILGTDFSLEVVRSAWARRTLRPPRGYTINKLGDISVLEMVPEPQTHFAPLSEALCKVVADLNGEADTNAIRVKLEENFPEMQTPSEEILQKSLNSLVRERKLHYTAGGYYVSERQEKHHPSFERQMLMTNEEAIVKLHGDASRENLLTQTCSHLQMMDIQIGNNEEKREGEGKQESVLAKILKRMKSNKQHITFSAQFPPPDTLLCHSVATQTQKIYSPLQEHKIPWDFLRNGGDSFQNSGKGNIIPTYRHSLSSAFKRRHRQRTSSSESSKITKTPAKFPADKCESKISSGSNPYKPSPPHKSTPEKRHKPPKQYSKAPLTKQVKKIQEVTSSNDNNIPSRNDNPTEDIEKVLSSFDSLKKAIPVDKQDIVIDNTLSVETSKGNVSTTVVTEETTVTQGKVVTVTSITTSFMRNKSSGIEAKKNDLNQESANISELM